VLPSAGFALAAKGCITNNVSVSYNWVLKDIQNWKVCWPEDEWCHVTPVSYGTMLHVCLVQWENMSGCVATRSD